MGGDELLELGVPVAVLVANATACWDAVEVTGHGVDAIRARAAIEQAKGRIMATRRCTADEADRPPVRSAQREDRQLRDVARQVVQPPPATSPPDPA